MKRSYAETTPEDTPKRSFYEVAMKTAWACAGRGEAFTEQDLRDALVVEWGVSQLLAEGLMAGVNELSDYAMSDVVGDALDEESRGVEVSRACTRPLFEARLQLRLEHVDDELRGEVFCSVPGCGAKCRSRGLQKRTRISKLSPVTTERRWSLCEEHGGFAAGDHALLLPASDFTAEVEEAATLLATAGTSGMAEKLMWQLLGLKVSDHAIQKMTNDRGHYAGKRTTRRLKSMTRLSPTAREEADSPPENRSEATESCLHRGRRCGADDTRTRPHALISG